MRKRRAVERRAEPPVRVQKVFTALAGDLIWAGAWNSWLCPSWSRDSAETGAYTAS
jgi:hypothetical protein